MKTNKTLIVELAILAHKNKENHSLCITIGSIINILGDQCPISLTNDQTSFVEDLISDAAPESEEPKWRLRIKEIVVLIASLATINKLR